MNTTSKFQTLLGKVLTYFILLSCLAILGLYAVQRFGAQYAEEKIQEQLERSGLASLVRYQSVYFNPFTLTPSLEGVSVGAENAPWLRFARISFNSYMIKHPNLDIDFWIQESPIDGLSRDTGRLMRAAGIDTLLGKGSFTSQIKNEHVSSVLKIDIKDLGKITLDSAITRLNNSVDLSDLRTDLLASLALGQPEALAIIYGEGIELHSLTVKYEELGLIHHLFPPSDLQPKVIQDQLITLSLASQALGLAPADSPQAKQIATAVQAFLQEPKQLTLAMSPASPISLKALTLLANEGTLYKNSQMTLQSN
ncbi:hypothetical protein HGG82_16045 [Marinomonas sp. M1K-6]|uniref:DUF2125 domain-containing protein n=1 Tax=Marinomonas profundi TaxID=2726122 RepID=A0A847RDI2_9GAMM|nr:hypothetical protein [Marinomonas profundi]NLQ19114.1 hypothetical protein [Marinomonas profundi]UDV02087.1 hypothetical protein J8N69_10820 [Marinomonas profundi]